MTLVSHLWQWPQLCKYAPRSSASAAWWGLRAGTRPLARGPRGRGNDPRSGREDPLVAIRPDLPRVSARPHRGLDRLALFVPPGVGTLYPAPARTHGGRSGERGLRGCPGGGRAGARVARAAVGALRGERAVHRRREGGEHVGAGPPHRPGPRARARDASPRARDPPRHGRPSRVRSPRHRALRGDASLGRLERHWAAPEALRDVAGRAVSQAHGPDAGELLHAASREARRGPALPLRRA